MPNGEYHVSVFCGDSYNREDQVNSLVITDKQLVDGETRAETERHAQFRLAKTVQYSARFRLARCEYRRPPNQILCRW